MSESYGEAYRRRMNAFRPGLAEQLDQIPTLPEKDATAIVTYLLELACQPTHMGPITIGRRALVRIPREWLVPQLEAVASTVLNLDDDWEFRRYVELCCFVDPLFAERVALDGLASDNPHVREAAADAVGGSATFARQYAGSVRPSPE